MSARGNEIRFVKGKYKGYYGWINSDESETLHSVPVIVQDYKKPDGTTHNKETKVRKTSVRPRQLTSPRCFEEAVFQQHPDIEDQMEKLCKALIQCEIDRSSTMIQQIFARKLVKAGDKQSQLGNKAVWRQTNYGDNAVEGEGASGGII
jgi:hypothetical protein